MGPRPLTAFTTHSVATVTTIGQNFTLKVLISHPYLLK